MKHDSRGGNEIEDDTRGSQVKEPHTGDKPPNREHAWRKVNLSCIHAYCCSTLPFCWKEVSAVYGRISSPPALIQSLFLHPHRLLQSFSPCTPIFTTPILNNITLVAPRPFHTSSVIRSKTHEHRMVLHSGWSLPRPLFPCSLLARMLTWSETDCLMMLIRVCGESSVRVLSASFHVNVPFLSWFPAPYGQIRKTEEHTPRQQMQTLHNGPYGIELPYTNPSGCAQK